MSSTNDTEPALSVDETRAASLLGSFLRRENFAQLYRQVSDGQLIASDFQRACSAIDLLPAREHFVLGFLALGLAQVPSALSTDCNELVDQLVTARLATRDDLLGTVQTSGWIIIPALGGYLMSGVPAPYRSSSAIGASAYIGTDSLLLAGAIAGSKHRRILDLGCGAGLQGLLAAREAKEAVLTDIDDLSLSLSALNAVLNDVSHALSIRRGSFYEPVVGEQFDTIVVLPPYVPSVDASGTSSTVDGGRDGLEFIRPLLRQAAEHLTDGGEFIAICQLLCNDSGPLLMNELKSLSPRLEVRISVTNWHPLQPYVLELATRLAAHGSSLDVRTLMSRYLSSLRGLGVTGTCTADIRAVRRDGSSPRPPRLVGSAPLIRHSSVPIPAESVSFGDTRAMEVVCASGGLQVALNRATADLLRATDGRRTIEEIVTRAWNISSTRDALRCNLEDQAIERFLELARAGFVRL